jgi:hypothetical protein
MRGAKIVSPASIWANAMDCAPDLRGFHRRQQSVGQTDAETAGMLADQHGSNPSVAGYVLEANDTAVAKAANDVVTSGRHNR